MEELKKYLLEWEVKRLPSQEVLKLLMPIINKEIPGWRKPVLEQGLAYKVGLSTFSFMDDMEEKDVIELLSIWARQPRWMVLGSEHVDPAELLEICREHGIPYTVSRKGLQKAQKRLNAHLEENGPQDDVSAQLPEDITLPEGWVLLRTKEQYKDVGNMMGNCVFWNYWFLERDAAVIFNAERLTCAAWGPNGFLEAEQLIAGKTEYLTYLGLQMVLANASTISGAILVAIKTGFKDLISLEWAVGGALKVSAERVRQELKLLVQEGKVLKMSELYYTR